MRPLILAIALALTLTGCGTSASKTKVGSTPPSGAASLPTPTATETTAPTVPGFRLLSKAALTDALLSLSDMPPGFTLDKPGTTDTDKTSCDYKPPFEEELKTAHDFTNDADQQFISVSFRQYASTDQGKASFDALVNEMKTCKTERFEGDTWTYSVMSAPRLGDGTIGLQLEAGGYTIKQNFVIVGPTLISVGGIGVDAQKVADLAALQVQRYTAAAQ